MTKPLTRASALLCLSIVAACGSAPEEEITSSRDELSVAGTTLTAPQARSIAQIEAAVPLLPGTAQERAHHAAIVAWWSLKEGVAGLPNPTLHNLCTQNGKDVTIGSTEQCFGPAWQVGVSGIQVPNVTDAEVLDTAAEVHPGTTTNAILTDVANAAGVAPATVIATTGRVRSGWLLRDPAIGVALQWRFADDCVAGGPSWCYGGWPEARAFASSLSRIQSVVTALEQRFLGAPAPSATPPGASGGDLCAGATLGDGLYCATWFGAANDPNVLLDCRGRRTASKTTCPGSCQRMADGQNDRCAAASSSSGALSPTRAAMMDRARQWVSAKMPYCGAVPGGWDGICGVTCTGRARRADWDVYRSDCSGFVSWVWQLQYQDGHRTWGFAPFHQEGAAFSQTIPASSLKPGDALNSATTDIASQHIVLFAGWADEANGIIQTLEEANCSADLVVNDARKMTINGDGTVSLEGRAFWPIRKLGVD